MKKGHSFLVILGFLILIFAAPAYSWQGRMAGMGDPYGLLEDESDFLIHPAGIAKGQGIAFYGHYRFTWRDVKDWNYTATALDPTTGGLIETWPYRGSGHEQQHNGLLGAAFPLGSGRMGLFFEYLGKRGDFDGDEDNRAPGDSWYHLYRLENHLDSFALRLLSGFPMGDFKVGGEIQLAHRREENRTFFNEDWFGGGVGTRNFITNDIFGQFIEWTNLFPFMFPFDSKSYEAIFKGSLDGALGAAKISLTGRGGFIFSGDNKLKTKETYPSAGSIDMDGNVEGWRLGGDFWLRYPLKNGLSVPLVLRIEYQKKTRDGDGTGTGTYAGSTFDYENEQRIFQVEAGGGIDKELSKGTRIAGGLYYRYLQNRNDFLLTELYLPQQANYDHSGYPDQTEHRLTIRLLGEKEFSSSVAIRMGLNFFYGWVSEDYKFAYTDIVTPSDNYSTRTSLDGNRWGINASLGSTFKFQRFSLEPFIGGGYENLNLDGDGFNGYYDAPVEWDKKRKEWFIGGGFSIKF